MFVDSLRRTRPVRASAGDEPPLEAVFRLPQRPLYVTVIWGNPAIDDEDYETVIEFESHLAAVLLTDPAPASEAGSPASTLDHRLIQGEAAWLNP